MSMYVSGTKGCILEYMVQLIQILTGEAIPCHQSWGEGSREKEEDRNRERDKQRERDMGVEAVAVLLPVS